MSKCIAVSPFTMAAALAAADPILGNPTWSGNSDNSEQAAWLESFRRRAAIADKMAEIKSNATTSAADHVAWLRAEGWDAQVTQGGPLDLFLAATLNVVAKWKEIGRAYKDGTVDRVLLKSGAYTSPRQAGQAHVVEVITQHPSFNFCFLQVDAAPESAAELLEIAIDMTSRRAVEKVHLDFPMVDLTVRDDARYMIGLHSGPNVVTQAAEQFRLELNEVGGRASAAAEVAVTRSLGPRTIKIDGPFIVAVNRNGAPNDVDKVAFAAYVDQTAWKRPADGRI